MIIVGHHAHWLQDDRDTDVYRQRMVPLGDLLLLEEAFPSESIDMSTDATRLSKARQRRRERQTIGLQIASDSGYSQAKGLDYALKQVEAQEHQLPLHETPFISPDDRSYIRNYAVRARGRSNLRNWFRPSVNPESIMDYERFRHEDSYATSSDLQQQAMNAEGQEDFQQKLADTRDRRQEQIQAMSSPEVTDDVREKIRQYAQEHEGDADAMLEWEQHRRDTLPQNVEAREQQAAIWRATRKKIATRAALGVGGVALVGGGLYLGSKYGNFSLNPVDWFHHK